MPRVAMLVAEDPQHGVDLLMQAHRTLGHTVELLDLSRCLPVCDGYPAAVVLPGFDVAHSRASAWWSLDVQGAISAAGVRVVNSPAGHRAGRDKWLCTRLLQREGLPVAPTVLVPPGTEPETVLDSLGDDIVVKPLAGHSGQNVVRCRDRAELLTALRRAADHGEPLLAQPYLETGGTDWRLIVVGGRVVGCYRRHAPAGDFRTNSGRPGARLEACPVDADLERIALEAAAACGLEIAGVDIADTRRGLLIWEANTNCGIVTDLSTVTGRSVALEMAAYVGAQAA
jgi:ribosomal protein S6--L-glutamate ligase